MKAPKKQSDFMMPAPRKKFRFKKFLLDKKTLVVFGVLVVGFIAFRAVSAKKDKGNVTKERVTTVLVRPAKKSSLKRFLDLYAELKASGEVTITSPVAGKVLNLTRLEGQTVTRNQTVLTIDRFEVGVRYAPAPVASSASGVVTRVLVDKGQDVRAGDPVAVVGDPKIFEALIRVPESSAAEVKLGQDVFFQTRSIPNKIFKGAVTRRDISLDPDSRTLTVRASLSNTGELFSGIYAESFIFVEEASDIYVVPDSALTKTKDGQEAIYVSVNDQAELRPVKVALRYRDQVAIEEGINDGEQIIVFGREYLSPGVMVRPLPEETISNAAPVTDINK